MWKSSEHSKISDLYKLKCTLGRGHFAVVKLAEHVFSGEKVAIKVIDKTKMDKASADHLYHEVNCMKLVQHPNVVRLYQVIETTSKLYLILELGDGGDMFDHIMRHDRGLHEDIAKEYFAQIVSAIAYCHKLHIVHRDLKPENVVFFETQGLVKLTDFGFSNRYQPGEKLSTSCGSLAYSAPEILLGEEYDAPAVDVWSLGVILYMLVCGVAPFNEANDSETLINIMDCRYTMMDHVSEQCQDLIQRMIIREPSERIVLNDIANHPWLVGAKSLRRARRNSTPILVKNSIPEELHQDIVEIMSKAKLADNEEIMKALEEDRYDHITSTYFLLAERKLLQQEASSQADLSRNPSLDEEQLDCVVEQITFGDDHINAKPIPNTLRPMHAGMQHFSSNTASLYSISPPCKQALCLPPPVLMTNDLARKRTVSSGSEESNLPFIHSKNPSHIREHLTITPRHGFSVAHGGIDTLLEEEERSRSQTTTDDEGDAGDDIGYRLNPNTLASHLQRASLQMKRIKKRKSAPVLNEICEENESESDFAEMVREDHRAIHHGDHVRQSGRQAASMSSPNSASRHQKSILQDTFLANGSRSPTKQGKLSTWSGARTGRSLRRRRSHRSSSSETSDDDSESQRASTTNLSDAAKVILFGRRDSSDDDDKGFGGKRNLHQDENMMKDIICDTNTENEASADSEQLCKVNEPVSDDHGHGHQESNDALLNNLADLPVFSKRLGNLDGTDHKIINMFGIRSRSAESHTSSHSTAKSSRSCSSARSSCSSLSTNTRFRPILKRGGRWVLKNSSSTRSDTGLVLRCHMKNLKTPLNLQHHTATFDRRCSSSFSCSSLLNGNGALRVCSSLGCVDPKPPVLDAASESDGCISHTLYGRSSSLPRRHRKSSKFARRNLNEFKHNVLGTSTIAPSSLIASQADGGNFRTTSMESLIIKQSNLSLASSTCSGSKYVVDPLNELPPSPCLAPLPESSTRELTCCVMKLEMPENDACAVSLNFPDSEKKRSLSLGSQCSIDYKHMVSGNVYYHRSKRLGIINRLNSLKSASQNSRSVLSSSVCRSESAILHKVKARECCTIM